MKTISKLMPIIIILLFGLSVYKLYTTRYENVVNYKQYLKMAREYRKDQIIVDAKENYELALNIFPSADLYKEIGDMYFENENYSSAEAYADILTDKYPKKSIGYEFGFEIALTRNDMVNCFKYYDKAVKRGALSKKLKKMYGDIEYSYYMLGSCYQVGEEAEGLIPACDEITYTDDDEEIINWYYRGVSGKTEIGTQFVKVGSFSGDYAPIVKYNDKTKKNEVYFIDKVGNKRHILKVKGKEFKEYTAVYNDKFGAFDGEKWAFYDWENHKLFGDYDEVTSLKNGIAAVRNGDSWTLINEKGKQITKKTFVDVKDNGREEVYSNGIIVATENGETYSFYDKNGKKVGKTEFEDADAFNENGYAAVKIDGKWGFADNKGNVVIKPKYKEAKSYSCGYASVENENGLWGYINEDEKLVIDYEFDDGNDFTSAGTALVKNNYSWSTLILYKYNHED